MNSSIWTRTAKEAPSDLKVVRIVVIVVLTLLAFDLIEHLSRPLMWLVIAIILAIATAAPVNFLAQHMKRGFAIAIVYFSLLLVPIMLGALLLPPLVESGVNLAQDAPDYARDFREQLQSNDTFRRLDENFDINQKLYEFANDLSGSLDDAAGLLGDIGAGVINSIFAGFTIFILSMFLVARGRGWVDAWISRQPPQHHDALGRTARRIGTAVGGYIGGAMAQAFIAGLAAFIVLSILGAPSPLVLAAIVAAFDVVPMVGSTIAGVLVGIVTLFTGFPVDTIIWFLFVLGYQQFENYIVQPQIQRRAVQLEPFIVLVAVIFGGTLMGVLGAILAIPVAATIQIIIQERASYMREIATDSPESATPV